MKSPNGKNRNPSPPGRRGGKQVKPAKLRIIGGGMRGRTVLYHGAEFTRPMKDNIRENLFNILNKAIKGAIAIDLFAGTGALGFESLSRGANSVVMVEQNRQAARFIEQTAQSLDIQDRMRLVSADAFRVAPSLLAPPADDTPWVVFLSPPYALWTDTFDELNRIIQQTLANAPPGSVLVTETDKTFDTSRLPGVQSNQWDFRTYGNITLGFIEPASVCGMNL